MIRANDFLIKRLDSRNIQISRKSVVRYFRNYTNAVRYALAQDKLSLDESILLELEEYRAELRRIAGVEIELDSS